MGKNVEFPSNGHTCQGYFAAPASGNGPAVVVIQEWWGLVEHIQDVVDRFAAEGFVAIAPDLYHGKTTKSPDEAGQDADGARRRARRSRDRRRRRLSAAAPGMLVVEVRRGRLLHGRRAGAVRRHEGSRRTSAPWSASTAASSRSSRSGRTCRRAVLLIYGENDKGVPAESGRQLEAKLQKLGKNAEVVIYPDADHAFFNDTRPNYKPEAAADAWRRTLEFFRQHL